MPARPRTHVTRTFTLPADLSYAVDEAARRGGLSFSAFVRVVLNERLFERGSEPLLIPAMIPKDRMVEMKLGK